MTEPLIVLDGVSKISGNSEYLNAAYSKYAVQCKEGQKQPEPAALWISKAASAEVAKARGLLTKHRAEDGAAPKKRHVAPGGEDAHT